VGARPIEAACFSLGLGVVFFAKVDKDRDCRLERVSVDDLVQTVAPNLISNGVEKLLLKSLNDSLLENFLGMRSELLHKLRVVQVILEVLEEAVSHVGKDCVVVPCLDELLKEGLAGQCFHYRRNLGLEVAVQNLFVKLIDILTIVVLVTFGLNLRSDGLELCKSGYLGRLSA